MSLRDSGAARHAQPLPERARFPTCPPVHEPVEAGAITPAAFPDRRRERGPLPREMLLTLVAMRLYGASQRDIARRLGVSLFAVRAWCKRCSMGYGWTNTKGRPPQDDEYA